MVFFRPHGDLTDFVLLSTVDLHTLISVGLGREGGGR